MNTEKTPTGKGHPKAGDYKNDCPFCRTHNALILKEFNTPLGSTYGCRDCHREFITAQEAEGPVWVQIIG